MLTMGSSHTDLLYHIIFSTKNRTPWIDDNLTAPLCEYMGGIVRGEGGNLIAIGGIADHLHLLIRWRPDKSLSDLMRQLKANSSKWIHESRRDLIDFHWQDGYAAFSVSRSQEFRVRQYITNQPAHHRTKSFEEELVAFLDAHGVEYDPRYL